MLRFIAALNAVLDSAFDVLFRPLGALPPIASLALVSLVTAIVMLLVVRRTSNQRALDEVKRHIQASLFEIRLFNDDMRAIFRAQREMLQHNLTYLRLSLVPMLWMIVPFVFVIAQLQFYYGYDGLTIRQPVLLTAHLRSTGVLAALDAPAGIHSASDAIWFPAANDLVWRITAEAPGDYVLRLRVGSETFSKTLHVSTKVARRSPSRLEAGFFNELLYPSEPPLPDDAPFTSIALAYPERQVLVFGRQVSWMIVFFVLSIAFALALRTPLRVTL